MEQLKNINIDIKDFEGEIFTQESQRLMYATDASAYREVPAALAIPKNKNDIQKLIRFSSANQLNLIPRAAGTSLAGQVVGNGIVVDISKYFTKILEINPDECWVKVEPGVVLDELNLALKPYGLFFGPETSTANRCMIGGMIGNNACGTHSLVYGSTRDHLLELDCILSDGSEVQFKALSKEQFQEKCELNNLEGKIYRKINTVLSDPELQKEIQQQYPHPELKRRNTGYALDLLLNSEPFSEQGQAFNLCQMLAGSEGTLAFTLSAKLKLVPLPPEESALVCFHFPSLHDALKANLLALKHSPVAIELMDKSILDLTKENIEQNRNRFFVEGDPEAILIVELAEETQDELQKKTDEIIGDLKEKSQTFAFPVVKGNDIKRVWDLRKAGLGIINNIPGDAKPAPVVEDTAVLPEFLPDYISEFEELLKKYGKSCIYYAHIATGELHLRPVLNLKDPKEVELFRTIAQESALLVKKYKGSVSGEHGDGRLRGEFIPLVFGNTLYSVFREIKNTFDPDGIFNPRKIVDTPRMNTSLRTVPGKETPKIETVFSFDKDLGIVRAAEKCNGAAACRKTEKIGGTMCPSYMATRDEKHSTRARANLLREFLNRPAAKNPFDYEELYEVMDLCLSCKACKSECPSSVDVAKLKAEFLQHYYDANGIPLRTRMIAWLPAINRYLSIFPGLSNFVLSNSVLSGLIKKILSFAEERSIPLLNKTSIRSWAKNHQSDKNGKLVYLFNDEFSNFNDSPIGIKTILLLERLGYKVVIPKHVESGRTFLSKGLIRTAQKIARKNVMLLKDLVSEDKPLVGIEPSAILCFRDEYPDLAGKNLEKDAQKLSTCCFTLDEFLDREIQAGNIKTEQFTDEKREIHLHGHCQQKALATLQPLISCLSLPKNYSVEVIPSGCCGMAGSFGYEKEHFEISQKIGELVLFPHVRQMNAEQIIAASGTSCRHQIFDGTGKKALHPAEILFEALC